MNGKPIFGLHSPPIHLTVATDGLCPSSNMLDLLAYYTVFLIALLHSNKKTDSNCIHSVAYG